MALGEISIEQLHSEEVSIGLCQVAGLLELLVRYVWLFEECVPDCVQFFVRDGLDRKTALAEHEAIGNLGSVELFLLLYRGERRAQTGTEEKIIKRNLEMLSGFCAALPVLLVPGLHLLSNIESNLFRSCSFLKAKAALERAAAFESKFV
jgi:hypothetical protein